MKPEIANIFGAALQNQVQSLLENLGGMADIIEANFTQIKNIVEQHKDEVIKAISLEKNKEISELKSEMKEKDSQIMALKIKEGLLEGRDETIAALNRNVESLQHQLDALTHRDNCHQH